MPEEISSSNLTEMLSFVRRKVVVTKEEMTESFPTLADQSRILELKTKLPDDITYVMHPRGKGRFVFVTEETRTAIDSFRITKIGKQIRFKCRTIGEFTRVYNCIRAIFPEHTRIEDEAIIRDDNKGV